MTRSGLNVVPDPRRPLPVHPGDVREDFRLGGLAALRAAVRSVLWLRVRGRATNPAERAALVAWLDEEAATETARLVAELTRRYARPVPVPVPESSPGVTCAQCGQSFEPAQTTGRRRTKCWTCSPPRR